MPENEATEMSTIDRVNAAAALGHLTAGELHMLPIVKAAIALEASEEKVITFPGREDLDAWLEALESLYDAVREFQGGKS